MPQSEIPVPSAGLRPPGVRLRNKSNDIARVGLVVPAGDELEVSDYVAGQLVGQAPFEIVGPPAGEAGSEAVPPAGSDPASIEEAGGSAARRRSGRRG